MLLNHTLKITNSAPTERDIFSSFDFQSTFCYIFYMFVFFTDYHQVIFYFLNLEMHNKMQRLSFILKSTPDVRGGSRRCDSAAPVGGLRSRCFGGGRAGFVLRADRREKTHQGRWRPQGLPNGLGDRPAPRPPARPGPGSQLGAGPGPAHPSTNPRSAWRARRPEAARPADTWPVRSA